MIKKRIFNFLILEVLIAFLLIAMTILPFSSYPYRVFQKELFHLESMTMEPYFTNGFFESYKQKNNNKIILPDLKVPFSKGSPLLIKRKAAITITTNKKLTNAQLITVKLTLSSKNSTLTREKLFFYKPKQKKKNEI